MTDNPIRAPLPISQGGGLLLDADDTFATLKEIARELEQRHKIRLIVKQGPLSSSVLEIRSMLA